MQPKNKKWKQLFKASSTDLFSPFYLWLGLIILTICTLGPFVYLFSSSLSLEIELINGHIFPHAPTLKNYIGLLTGSNAVVFASALKNSVVVSVLVTLISIFVGVFAAYAFSRIKFPFRKTGLFVVLAVQIMPSISIITPLYIIIRDGIKIDIPFTGIVLFQTPPLLDSVWALVFSYTSFSLPYVVWLLAGYFQTIPKELEEASYVDGCNRLRTMFRIILPLSMPGIAATAIFAFLNAWDEFLFANAFTQTYASKTLPVMIAEFVGKHSIDWGAMTAGGFLASLPPVIISLFLYKYIIGGVTAGGVKE
ncbi:carbohydrate ABC transporter permease [Paenibacillus alba]|uniref:Carbohydrate ABC transporter permease n=1 Tax=Paenibacillus alba TaxID=1197127 RepID=A0ABU6GB06_9BACL|nr:carbohydrate ABC transporter permease [Paenibacillus alba]MEC0231380.1 carbohydrate ABC transporter permease [Paenibacillus alba]NQX66628.1 carbohydrate ABC transporter permease [Paenibacillus alba]